MPPLTPLRRLIFPSVLLVVALLLRYAIGGLSSEWRQILDWLPYASLGMALALAGYNSRSRLFALTAALIIIYYIIMSRLQVSLEGDEALAIYSLISIAFPLQVLFLLFIPERGLWNRYGAMVVSSVLLLLIAAGLIFHYVPEPLLRQFIENRMSVKPFPGYVLSVGATIVFILILLAALYRLCKRDHEHDAALVTVLLFMFVMLAVFDRPGISDLIFSLAGISLIVSIMRGSYELAYRDELTGLLGRRALNERLKTMGKQYVIAMVDVDHFKKFNDKYGHNSGDDVLKLVARQIAMVGGGGMAYRYGGEEFCIIFPGRTIEYCKPFLEAVRASIGAYRMVLRDTKNRPASKEAAKERRGRRLKRRNETVVSVTISIGAAASDQGYESPEEVIKAADAALYKAKKKGRNCVVISN